MVRTQIQLTQRQADALKQVAARRGLSVAELIRQSIDRLLMQAGERSEEELRAKALAAAGRFRSGRSDVALRHDEFLGEGFGI